MTVGGFIFIACILTVFAAFAAALAWGAHQTNAYLRDQQSKEHTNIAQDESRTKTIGHAKAA